MANHISDNDWLFFESIDERGLVIEGGLAEQFIGQHLLHPLQALQLCYWIREGKSSNAEVDYVISRGNLIVPIEVKACKSGSLKSLQKFVFRKRVALAVRFDLNPPSVQKLKNVIRTKEGSCDVEYTLVSLPLYMVEELPPILDDLRREQWDPRRSNMKTVKSFHEKSGWLRVKKAWPENLIHSSFWS